MEVNAVLIILVPLLTALLSSYMTYYFAMRSKRNEAMIKFKEEKYSNLIIALQGFVGATANRENKIKFFEEQYKSWLYSSDNVVLAINDLIALLMRNEGGVPDPAEGRKIVGNIILEMRKDLIGNTKLSYKEFRYIDVIDRK